jgi:hypothetical protein
MFFLLWFSPTVGEGRLWERLRIYSGKYLFNKSKFYLVKFQFFYAFCGTDITAGAQYATLTCGRCSGASVE